MKLEEFLKKERIKINKTQKEMANDIGISETYYILLEKGHKHAGILVINKIAQCFRVPVQRVRRMADETNK